MISGKLPAHSRCLCFFVVVWIMFLTSNASAANKNVEKQTTRDGTVTIPWHADYAKYNTLSVKGVNEEEIASYPVIADQGWVLSGLSSGNYSVFLTSTAKTIKVSDIRVQHFSLKSAGALFGLGFLMFCYLLYTLFHAQKVYG
ncbi:hypothetical protein CA267_018780 [Alteromonas pelagimontana]|uniref:Uncharacterized protein n=1 Tax=Alteromonas pelagimontana TaxID=1858656 RepID=A0A6M4MHP7_9ALTE|nr:hypothetical protein [Alteromonas pelagimontana]QJR82649.1 hypothetical protein CA267_018780 [Alteromonas pelagimontana]